LLLLVLLALPKVALELADLVAVVALGHVLHQYSIAYAYLHTLDYCLHCINILS
jgi:hypothetical protein